MTLKQIHELNEKFLSSAVQLSELIPSGGLTDAISIIIRSSRAIHDQFVKLIAAPSDAVFHRLIDTLEDELDEVVFILDQLEIANKKNRLSIVNDFLQEGYSLLSIYSRGIDHIIDKKVKSEE